MSDRPLYPPHNPWDLEPHYSLNKSHMTSEALHSKHDIAVQLAWRDQRIEQLEAELAALRAEHASCPTCVHGMPLSEANDPETVWVAITEGGTPIAAASNLGIAEMRARSWRERCISVGPTPLPHVVVYEKRNPEERAHLLKAAELFYEALTAPEVDLLPLSHGAWLDAEEKRRGESVSRVVWLVERLVGTAWRVDLLGKPYTNKRTAEAIAKDWAENLASDFRARAYVPRNPKPRKKKGARK